MNKAAFLAGLFVEEIEEILEWNRHRDAHEKKKLIMFLDCLYKFVKKTPPEMRSSSCSRRIIGEEQAEEDDTDMNSVDEGISGEGWVTRKRGGSCLSSISSWRRAPTDPDGSASSIGSTTAGSTQTRFSQRSATTSRSLPVGVLPIYKSDFRYHRRGFAVNTRSWNPQFNHEQSSPDSPIFPPKIKGSYGKRQMQPSFHIDFAHLRGVFRNEAIPIVINFMNACDGSRRILFMSVFRGMQSMHRLSHYDNVGDRLFSIEEDSRFWKPLRASPLMNTADLLKSSVPLGTLK